MPFIRFLCCAVVCLAKISESGSTVRAPADLTIKVGLSPNYLLEPSACMLALESPNSKENFFPWKRMPASEFGPLGF
jgi:hypothetical protein